MEACLPTSGRTNVAALTLTAVGVVYGDIGTSPLYAMRECFHGPHAVAPTHENVLGVLSLIVYALVLVVSVKYIAIVLRADNQGEGGILALTAPHSAELDGEPALVDPPRHLRRRAAVRRRHDYSCDHRAERGRGFERGHATLHPLRGSARGT